jgi:hypothetical protein
MAQTICKADFQQYYLPLATNHLVKIVFVTLKYFLIKIKLSKNGV